MIARQSWKKFGNYKRGKVTVEGEIEIEWVHQAKAGRLPAGYFVNKARQFDFPESIVREILRAENYEAVFDSYYAKLLDSYVERIKEIRNANEAKSKVETKSAVEPEAPRMLGGLRQRLKIITEKSAEEKKPEQKKGLTEVLNAQREDAEVSTAKCKLILRNVPVEFVERDIYEELADFQVTGVHVLRRAQFDGGPKTATGTAFVTVLNIEEAKDLMEYMQDVCWEHNVVSAEFADK